MGDNPQLLKLIGIISCGLFDQEFFNRIDPNRAFMLASLSFRFRLEADINAFCGNG